MVEIDWRELIEEAQNYDRFQHDYKEHERMEAKLRRTITYLEGILGLCNDSEYQLVFNSYMRAHVKATKEIRFKLESDIKRNKEELEVVRTNKKDAERYRNWSKTRILDNFLSKVMDSNSEELCRPCYCPPELVTKENLPFLKIIKDIADASAIYMYANGGFCGGKSVIGDLARKLDRK